MHAWNTDTRTKDGQEHVEWFTRSPRLQQAVVLGFALSPRSVRCQGGISMFFENSTDLDCTHDMHAPQQASSGGRKLVLSDLRSRSQEA